jgi:glycosyltransferase involved in cell wall biosynthesis
MKNDTGGSEIAIYRRSLLPYSETFILSQANALFRYHATLLGHEAVDGLPLPTEHTVVSPLGRSIAGKLCFARGFDPFLSRQIATRNVRLVHAHFGPDAAFARRFIKRAKLPMVATFHGYDVFVKDQFQPGRAGALWVRERERVFEDASTLLAVSSAVRDRLLELGAPHEKVVVHYIGVDTDLFSPGAPRGSDDRTVLYVGRLTHGKGILDLIRALQPLSAAIPFLSLRVVGEGPLKEAAARLATDLGVNAVFIGAQEPSVVVNEMRSARVFSVLSQSGPDGWREGFGLVYAEAQACGLPVVSYRSGGVPEAVQHGSGGLLVAPGDLDALSEALEALLTNDGIRDQYAADGRIRVVREFELANQTRKLERLYDSVL